MARLQIKMQNAPTKGVGAFMPTPYGVTTPAASSQGILHVEGYPGTLRVPSPRPAALDDGELGGPNNQPSSVAPNYFLPAIWIIRISSHLSMPSFKRTSTNVAPVPAGFVARSAGQTQRKTRIGGQTATSWPRQFTRFPTYRDVK